MYVYVYFICCVTQDKRASAVMNEELEQKKDDMIRRLSDFDINNKTLRRMLRSQQKQEVRCTCTMTPQRVFIVFSICVVKSSRLARFIHTKPGFETSQGTQSVLFVFCFILTFQCFHRVCDCERSVENLLLACSNWMQIRESHVPIVRDNGSSFSKCSTEPLIPFLCCKSRAVFCILSTII